jgi:hypothetical protein
MQIFSFLEYVNKLPLYIYLNGDRSSANKPLMDTVNQTNTDKMHDDDHMDDNEEVFSDVEEDVAHDHVTCANCGTRTHQSIGKCSKIGCDVVFKFSKAGYLIGGEEGDFICDGVEEEEESSSDNESEEEEETESESEEEEDEEMGDDDETPYEPKFSVDTVVAPRVRRSRKAKDHI